jgi:phospholipid/cholesterol/gamma-HCH transport system substrate-binding protein
VNNFDRNPSRVIFGGGNAAAPAQEAPRAAPAPAARAEQPRPAAGAQPRRAQ